MKILIKIILSNWINLLLIFCSAYLYAFFTAFFDETFSLTECFSSANYLIIFYGLPFFMAFIIFVFVLDIILFGFISYKNIYNKLLIELGIISLPYLFWVIQYNQYIFFVAMVAFVLGQYFRSLHLNRIINSISQKK